MSKLIFRYGTMGSAKSANLLTTAYNFEERGRQVICIKSEIDTRDEFGKISSRIKGLERNCYIINNSDNIYNKIIDIIFDNCYSFSKVVVFVDEVQFLTEDQIDQLVKFADTHDNVIIICYGLRTASDGHLFPGSKRLFEMADKIEEIKSICDCGNKAIINAKLNPDGTINYASDKIIDIEGITRYKALCRKCWNKLKNTI